MKFVTYVTVLPHWPAALLTVMFPGQVIVGIACTVTVAVILAPTQPSGDVGVIVKVTVCGTVVLLVSVPVISPVPADAIPVTFMSLSLTHANVVPGTSLVRMISVIGPEHTVCDAGVAVATGVGITVPVTGVRGALLQAGPGQRPSLSACACGAAPAPGGSIS